MALSDVLTSKQIQVRDTIKEHDWSILILHGAKRSGKTYANNLAFLLELKKISEYSKCNNVKEPKYILAGVSSKTIYNNVISELYNTFGLKINFDRHGSFSLFGVKVVLAHTGNIGGVGSIRGMTSYGAYINEASEANEEVFNEIKTRCSGDGARIICDTNPSYPEHWLKKDYIDKESESIEVIHFTMEDNDFLSRKYIDDMRKTTPKGMFYDRDILGLWVSGDGVIYKDFNEKEHYIQSKYLPDISYYYCGVDWGYGHYGSIVVMGKDDGGNHYLVQEYAKQGEEVEFWISVAKSIQDKYGKKTIFFCDSAGKEHIAKFRKNGIHAYKAKKSVIPGIESVARLLKTNKLFICEDRVNRFKKEIYQYVWDKNNEVKKENDDVLDALRYAVYNYQLHEEERKNKYY